MCEVAADIQTGEQYFSAGSINVQKHLATTETFLKTLIVFLKTAKLLEAKAATALSCFLKVNYLKSRMTPKIYNMKCIFHINSNLKYFQLIFIINVLIKIHS